MNNSKQPDCQCPSCLSLNLYNQAAMIAERTNAVVVLVPAENDAGERGLVASCYEVDLHPVDVAMYKGTAAICRAAMAAHEEVAALMREGDAHG